MSNRRKLRSQPQRGLRPDLVIVDDAGRFPSDSAFALALRESATATVERPTAVSLTETTAHPMVEASGQPGGHQLVQLIDAGWGSSGYYSPQLLAETVARGLFPKGLPMYLDHPTVTDEHERPERSVRDLAAVLTEDAHYDPGSKALVAQARVFAPYRETLTDLAEHIGLSIRAGGFAEHGEAEGRSGLIVKEITSVESVDYVTKAGRGGKVLALMESARSQPLKEARSFGAWLESRLHLTLTQYADEAYGDGRLTREERITLSGAISDGLRAWTARVEADAPQLFSRDVYEEPEAAPVAVSESDEPAETPAVSAEAVQAQPDDEPVKPAPQDSPADQPGDSTTEDAPGSPPADEKEGVMPEDLTTEVKAREAAELARVEAETKLAEALAAMAESERKAAENALKLARVEAVEAARPIATAALTESDLPAAAQTRVLTAVTRDVPLTESDTLDEAAFKTLVEAEVKAEGAYLASLAEADGAGQVRGMGGSSAPVTESSTSAANDATATALVEAYKARGMNPEAAKLAARGRAF